MPDKEIISIHPEEIATNEQYTIRWCRLNALSFLQEFECNSTIQSVYAGAVCGPTGINIHTIPSNILRDYIIKVLESDTKLIFDDSHEGILFYSVINKIHDAIKGTSINGSQLYYISATLNCDELYNKYCTDNNITNSINVYSINLWEYAITRSSGVKDRFNIIKNKEKLFLCFNRMFKTHRYALLGLLLEKDLVKNSYYSFFFNNYPGVKTADGSVALESTLTSLDGFLSEKTRNIIYKQIIGNKELFPLKINIKDTSNNKNYLDSDDMRFFDDSYFSLVTETGYFEYMWQQPANTIFFSEKIFKPILVRHPFILVSAAHSLKYLRKLGYKTFSPFIDESYDDIDNHEDRLLAIVNEIERLSKFNLEQWIEWQHNVEKIVDHNYVIISTRKMDEYAYSRPIIKT